jgi:hypothetical protein
LTQQRLEQIAGDPSFKYVAKFKAYLDKYKERAAIVKEANKLDGELKYFVNTYSKLRSSHVWGFLCRTARRATPATLIVMIAVMRRLVESRLRRGTLTAALRMRTVTMTRARIALMRMRM